MSIEVLDPFGVTADPELSSLALAIDPVMAQRELASGLPRLCGPRGVVRVRAIRVTRYKPGRRCVIEYDVEVERPGSPVEHLTLVGKVRRQRFGKSGYRLLEAFWNAGFGASAEDGISVPEPIGTVSKFRMWLQRKVPGRVATVLLTHPRAEALAQRIAEAADKLHRAAVPTTSWHSVADELRILHDCLPQVVRQKPDLAKRIEGVLVACDRLGIATPQSTRRGIHRDFYADQVIVDGERLHLIDFDQYCAGDPALDIGNFLGCMTEYSLRAFGHPDALANVATAMEERFLELAGEVHRRAVHAYALLTLVRHVYVSVRIPERRRFTLSLLALCEDRLGIARCVHV